VTTNVDCAMVRQSAEIQSDKQALLSFLVFITRWAGREDQSWFSLQRQ